ncbi:MAG: BCAM0308 family protein [Desulfurobacteriaceae bacterium]
MGGQSYIPAGRKEYTWESDNPYYERKKYPEPTKCPECGAIFKDGRWQWPEQINGEIPKDLHETLCPACRRKRDRYPGGFLYLSGKFFEEHKEDILNTIKNVIDEVSAQRPLQRILWTKETENGIEIATTSEHLARHLGEAVNNAFKGDFKVNYSEGQKLARVFWHRD